MVSFDELMRYRNKHSGNRFNIIGFSNASDWRPSKSCPFCHVILIPRVNLKTGEDMPGLMCPKCGHPVEPNEAPTEEGIKGKFSGKQETMIISGKSKKKYYDKQGNEINDPDLIAEAQKGNTVISYHEEKQGQDTIIDKNTRRVIRSKRK